MGSFVMRFGNRIVRFGDDENENTNSQDVEMYDEACKEAKKGIAIIMEGLDSEDGETIEMGAARAWEGIKTMKKLANKMKRQFGERRFDSRGYNNRNYGRGGTYGNRSHDDREEWNERDDEWMERRMRDSMGRFK